MKITITAHEKTHTTETSYDDLTTDEVAEIITNLLICVGFGKEGIIEAFKDLEL
jgi:hypothetical protein